MPQNMNIRLPQSDIQGLKNLAVIKSRESKTTYSVSEALRDVIHTCLQNPAVVIPNAIQRRILSEETFDLPSDKSTSFYVDEDTAQAFRNTAKKAGYKVEGLLKLLVEDRLLH